MSYTSFRLRKNSQKHCPCSAFQRQQQTGAAAIEFALIFTLLFGLFWAILAYSIPFFIYQVMSHAASESSRIALHADVNSQSDSFIVNLASTELTRQLGVLPASIRTQVVPANAVQISTIAGHKTLVVQLLYPGCNNTDKIATCVVPPLNLIVASLPNLPAYSVSAQERLR